MTDSSSSLKHNSSFQRYFEEHLQPIEAELETLRRNGRAQRNKRVIAALAGWGSCLALVLLWLRPQAEVGWWTFGFFMLVLMVCLAVWAWAPVLAHIGRVKEQVLPRMLPFFGGFQYQWDPELNLGQYASFKVLPRHNKPFVEDLIEGVYNGVPVRAAELRLRHERSVSRPGETGSRTESTSVFRGMLAEVTVGEDFPGVTLIGTAGEFKDYFRIEKEDELHQQESVSGFNVFTSEQTLSPLLTPALLTELKSIANLFEASKLMISFRGQKIVLLLEHKGDFFEISTGKTTDLMRDADHIKKQVDKIFEIVERLGFRGPEVTASPVSAVPSAAVPAAAFAMDDSRYDVGGWGCLGALALWILATAGLASLLESRVSLMALLPWSAAGGLLAASGLYQLMKAVRHKKAGALFLSLLFLAGAGWILYNHWEPDPTDEKPADAVSSQVQRTTAAPPPPIVMPSQPVTSWLEPALPSGILRSSIEFTESQLRSGETSGVTIKVANNTPQDLNLSVEATLNSLAYLVDASHGGELAGENFDSQRTVVWTNLALPSRRMGKLELTVLIEAIYHSEVQIQVSAKDGVKFSESLNMSKPHNYADGDSTGNWWFGLVMAGTAMSIIGGFWGQRMPRHSRVRQVLTRGAIGYFSLLFGFLGALLLWSVITPLTAYAPTQCEVLDARSDGSLNVAARFDSPSGTHIATGSASSAVFETLTRGSQVPCWHHNTNHSRLALNNSMDGVGLGFGLVLLVLGLGFGWMAVRRKGVPVNKR